MKRSLNVFCALILAVTIIFSSVITVGFAESEATQEPAVTATPTVEPTATPTAEPTAAPTEEPTAPPTAEPTAAPTEEPTATPTEEPTATPTEEPTATPTEEPTATPTAEPTATPTAEPTATPTEEPTATPTATPEAEVVIPVEATKYVKITSATSADYNKSLIVWSNTMPNVDYYDVYRALSSGGSYEQVARVDAPDQQCIDKGLISGTTYWYRVIATDTFGTRSEYSDPVAVTIRPNAVTGLTAKSASSSSIDLKWDAVNGASGYNIYRSESAGADELISYVTTLTYTDMYLTTGASYMYFVRAYRTVDGVNILGDPSAHVQCIPVPLPPEGLTVTRNTYNSLNVSWTTNMDAETYNVYRAKENNTFQLLYEGLTDVSLVDTNLETGTIYYYCITSVTGGEESVKSGDVSRIPIPVVPQGLTATLKPSSTVQLAWNNTAINDGFDGYRLWRSLVPGKKGIVITRIDSPSITSYWDQSIPISNTGLTYYYEIQGYTTTAQGIVFSDRSTQVACQLKPDTPTGLTVDNVEFNSLSISWGAVANADGYMVYRSLTANGSYSKIATVVKSGGNTETYLDSPLTPGTTYYYRVLSYVTPAGEDVTSPFSVTKSGVPRPARPQNVEIDDDKTTATSLKLSWNAVNGATIYKVYGRVAGVGSYVLLKTVRNTTAAVVSNLSAGITYQFRVRGVCKAATGNVFGLLSAAIKGTPVPGEGIITKASSVAFSRISLTWKNLTGVTGYEISSSDTDNGEKTIIGYSSALTREFDAIPGKKVFYFVRGFTNTTGATIYGKYSAAVSVASVPARPVVQSVDPEIYDGTKFSVNWKVSSDVIAANKSGGYILQRSVNGSAYAEVYRTDNLNVNSYLDTNVTPGNMYYYRIRTYADTDYGVRKSLFSVASKNLSQAGATGLKAVGYDYESVKLKWKIAAGSDGYEIYYRKVGTSNYTFLKRINGGTTSRFITKGYVALNLSADYEFYVVSFKFYGTARYFSMKSNTYITSPVLAAPKNVTASYPQDGRIRVSWNAVADAQQYLVYQSSTKTGTYNLVATVSSSTRTVDISTAMGVTAWFKVRAKHIDSNQSEVGTMSAAAQAKLAMPWNFKGTVVDLNSITFKWDTVYGAKGYQIIARKSGTTDAYAVIKDEISAGANSITLTNIPAATSYDYRIMAYQMVGTSGVKYTGIKSVVRSIGTYPPAPANFTATPRTNGNITLTWSRSPQCTGYYIRYKLNNNKWKTLKVVPHTNVLSYTFGPSRVGAATGDTIVFTIASYYNPTNPNVVLNQSPKSVSNTVKFQ